MSPDCPLGRRWYKMVQSSHVIWDFEAERDQDYWIHHNARTAGGKRNGKLSGTLCARLKLDFQSFQHVDDMNNDAGWWYVWLHIGYCMSYMMLYDNISVFKIFAHLCSTCSSVPVVSVFFVLWCLVFQLCLKTWEMMAQMRLKAIRFWCFSQGWKLSPFWPFWGYCDGYNTICTYYNSHIF